jgi:hypothetical protein
MHVCMYVSSARHRHIHVDINRNYHHVFMYVCVYVCMLSEATVHVVIAIIRRSNN